MCLIAVKPRKARFDMSKLAIAAENNPHGAGIAWVRKGVLYTVRRMTFDALASIVESAQNYPSVVHLRFATHGVKTVENVHPFHVKGHAGLVFAHNGIINSLSTHADLSDTRMFNRDVLSKLPHRFEESPKFLEGIANATSSKFAFLRRDGHWFLSGKFHKKGGVHYSNYSYLPRVMCYENLTDADLNKLLARPTFVKEESGQLRVGMI